MMSFSMWQKLAAAMIENAVRCGLNAVLVLALVTVAMMNSSPVPGGRRETCLYFFPLLFILFLACIFALDDFLCEWAKWQKTIP
ncbi:hypothetical protein G6M70_25865 [Agrobacterium tumefaciens]|uniref:hypothetical protein n=1 Tax=Agrobacterium tumefaciens TaxID=358 RepID=UPI00157319BD|nr:hypothetical protein [Agrobacterium tumefaciens]NSZ02227.1 hypothetical protein [Agrobacterium tumefaciens]NSZ40015.1 hypothetical protein [Agrobacterium tumefaciens]NTB26069.1 hypothetical protein [Agrobacterium tumefaciens]NTB26957.1 hypothetical protein [Agrobacterium tumefaciens]NTB33637.1 hypothetical protein [Agrobacterium tumefaciens]